MRTSYYKKFYVGFENRFLKIKHISLSYIDNNQYDLEQDKTANCHISVDLFDSEFQLLKKSVC